MAITPPGAGESLATYTIGSAADQPASGQKLFPQLVWHGTGASLGPVTAGNPLPVVLSGAIGTLTVTVDGPVVTDGLTDAELRAAPVPVTVGGDVPVSGPLTDAQLRDAPVPVALEAGGPLSVVLDDAAEYTWTNGDGTLAADGDLDTPGQVVFPASPGRRFLKLHNWSAADLRFDGLLGGFEIIAPGKGLVLTGATLPRGEIRVNGATEGQAFSARSGV